MTDKEMLEYAAKAAGVEGRLMTKGDGDLWLFRNDCCDPWNPLTDDGDALRLAVKLRLGTLFPTEIGRDRVDVKGHTESLALNDPLAATRRAITRAAAEIGKGMK